MLTCKLTAVYDFYSPGRLDTRYPCTTKVFQVVKKPWIQLKVLKSSGAWKYSSCYPCDTNAVLLAFPGCRRPGALLMSKSSNLLLNLEAHAAGRPNLISPPSSLWGPESVGSRCVSSPSLPLPCTHVAGGARVSPTPDFFLWPKNRRLHNDTSKMMLFLEETVKLQEKKKKKERTKNAI